ncbi:hypothetical protein PVAND_007773 [Polypedilum vanderplanki]|uniref:Fringe-like glycosyltransferase domain-containing protein n=1 Tax=Polypedilum vanderplanki TaxID=319348 RepID=A0A9J6C7Z0_POLVA|nr:hypothetical protein PVAND_007773 [Polypedilum vanderplanki]
MRKFVIILLSFILLTPTCGMFSDEISFLVLSQKNKYHLGVAKQLKHTIIEQSLNLDDGTKPNIYLSHEVFEKSNSWAIVPILIDILNQLITPQTKWLLLCEANSVINLRKLLQRLSEEDEKQAVYLGYPLYDREATIIHHFAFFRNPSEFKYPFLKAGVAFSIPLLNRLVDRLLLSSTKHIVLPKAPTDFTIDPAHELALFIWNVDKNLILKPVPYLCSHHGPECAIYAREENIFCGNPISLDKVLFAVKTCEKYHKERLPLLLQTWARFTIHLRIFSDALDETIPTIATGVLNTEHGHCEKSMKILRMVLEEIQRNSTLKNIEFIVLADDDTLLSISSLSEYLGCFDKREYIYLGERYGYDLFSDDSGYSYITGGGGIVFDVKTIRKLVNSCSCASPSSPDDMIIASCLKSLEIEPIHSSLFHQARSKDYAPEILSRNAISFHKFWQIDPLEIYEWWFRKRDEEYYELNKQVLSDYKYLKNSCVTPSTTNNKIENKISHNVKHVEL